MIVDPAKLGISMVVSVVLLIGGVMALATDDPTIVIDERLPSLPVASESAVPSQTSTNDPVVEPAIAGNSAEQIDEQTTIKNDTMEVEVMTADLAAFDPITSGDWSLDNLSDYALEITQ